MPPLALVAAVGAGACVIVTIVLASGEVAGPGPVALGAATFLLLAVWCFTSTRVDRALVVLALYLGLLDGYIKLRTGSPTITLLRDALVIAIAGGALIRSVTMRQGIVLPPLSGYVLAFSAVVLIELVNPSSRGWAAGLAGLRQHLEFVPLFFLGFAFVRSHSQIRKALLIVIFCAAAGGVVSYIQSTLTPEELAGWGPGYAERVLGTGNFAGAGRVAFEAAGTAVRPFGLGSDAGAGAAAAALALPGLVALLMAGTPRVRGCVVIMSAGVGLAVATSGSRAALITCFVALVAFALLAAVSRNAVKAVVGIAVAVGIIYGAFIQLGPDNGTAKRAQSVAPDKALATFSRERGDNVAAFGGIATNHPLGVGIGTVGPAGGFRRPSAGASLDSETQWNFLVIETGVAGVLIYVSLLLRLMWLSMTRIRRVADPALRLSLAALAAPIFAMLLAGFSGPTSVSVPTAPYLWLVSGVLAYWLVTLYRAGGTAGAAVAPTAAMRRR